MTPREIAQRIESLRKRRVRPDPNTSASPLFSRQQRALRTLERRIGNIADVWADLCPPAFLERTAIDGVRAGVLRINVRDAATRHEIDALLRTSLERELIRRSRVPIRRVKLQLRDIT